MQALVSFVFLDQPSQHPFSFQKKVFYLCNNYQVKDMLQLMIDATSVNGTDDRGLTIEDIAGFSIDFLLGGYATTANTLSYTTYLLAMNPDVQGKLQAEIDLYFKENPVS